MRRSTHLRRTNAELPCRLQRACAAHGARLIHFSTDCVFSGAPTAPPALGYTEEHAPDPVDLYGRSKLAGEVGGSGCLTCGPRSSGARSTGRVSLAGMAVLPAANVPAAMTASLSAFHDGGGRLGAELIQRHPDLSGIWHVGGEAMSKYDLLRLRSSAGSSISRSRPTRFQCDRRLEFGALPAGDRMDFAELGGNGRGGSRPASACAERTGQGRDPAAREAAHLTGNHSSPQPDASAARS